MLETFDYQHVIDLGVPCDRTPEVKRSLRLPAGSPIISADGHWSLSKDIFYERFPEHLKDRAPRVWQKDGAWVIGFDGQSMLNDVFVEVFGTFDVIPGCTDIEARAHDLAAEGVEKEIIFPNAFLAMLFYPDYEIREWTLKIYNEYLAELQAKSNGRFYGVAIPAWWDIEKFAQSIRDIKALGLKTFMLPNNPGQNLEGTDIVYESEEMEPFWAAIEEVGLPVCFHIGESVSEGRGGLPISSLINFGGFRKQFGQLIFGGIFDRHPSLQIVFVEAGILWAISCLHDAEIVYGNQAQLSDWKLQHPPRYYWQKHCYTTFMSEPLGLKLIDYVGVDRVLWTSDYPHPESTLGFGWKAIQEVIDTLGEEDAAKVLGKTAKALFDL